MSYVSLICFLVCLGIVFSTFRKNADVLSPARVFGFIWSLSIGLADLKLSGLQHRWSFQSWIILLIGPAAFLLGVFALYVLNLHTPILPLEAFRRRCRQLQVDKHRLFRAIVIFFVLFLVAYAVIVLTGHEIPFFSSRPGKARVEFQMFGIGLLLHNITEVGFFAVLYCVLVQGERLKKGFLVAASVICILMYALLVQRFPIIVTVLMILTVVYYATRHLRFRTVVLYAVAAAAFMLSISTFRMAVVLSYFVYVGSKMRIAPQFALLTEPYMYFVMSAEMFTRSIDRLQEFTYGYYTFDFVTALTGLKHWLEDYFNLVDTPYLISGYNTYSAFWTYYRDFGVLGVFAIGLAGGLIVSSLYYSFRREPRLTTLGAYSVCVFLMALSIVNSQFGFLWFVYNVALLYVVIRWVEPRVDGSQSVAGNTSSVWPHNSKAH